MTKVVNLADYRPKTEIRITGKLDSKKVCELMSMDDLLRAYSRIFVSICIDGQEIVLDKDDIEDEINRRE